MISQQYNQESNVIDYNITRYGFAGQPYYTLHRQDIWLGTGETQFVVTRTETKFDAMGRPSEKLIGIAHSAVNNGGFSSPKSFVKIKYDAIGQIKKKELGKQHSGNEPLENQTFDYNIRGWLLGVNRDFLMPSTSVSPGNSNWFGFELGYDKSNHKAGGAFFTDNQYNGNIKGQLWRTAGDGIQRSYHYMYDPANRLLTANFDQRNSNGTWNNEELDFSFWTDHSGQNNPEAAYDLNGNLKQFGHRGFKLGAATLWDKNIDVLEYTYFPNSNRLAKVMDQIPATGLGDFTDLNNSGADDYTYDANGNLTRDLNKRIGTTTNNGIIYNHLNQPQLITTYTETGVVKGTIAFTYDAAGNKLRKTVNEGTQTKTTIYAGGLVYEQLNNGQPTLLFAGHEEGRIRYLPAEGSTPAAMVFDYMLKDHLGNVRMVLTEEEKTMQYPAATLETNTIQNESLYYGNLSTAIATKPAWFNDPDYTTNARVARLKNNSTAQKVGPNMLLKVMAGDRYHIRVASGWSSTSSPTNSNTNVYNTLMEFISTGLAGSSGGKVTASQLQAPASGLGAAINAFLTNQPVEVTTRPRAYINWILFDEQFKMVPEGSGSEQVKESGAAYIHVKANLPVVKSGYLYIFTSNKTSNIDVYFDNLRVTHVSGPLLEETHYYPFGLTMAGISSKAAGKLENRYKFNEGTELNSDLDVSLYETEFRLYDPQIGRFHQFDKLGEFNSIVSGYVFASNNPISINDPDGLMDTLRVRKDGEVEYGEAGKSTTLDEVVITQNTRDKANPGNVSFYDNASLLRYRFNNGLPLINQYDRESYIRGLEDGSLVRQVERQKSAEDFESQFYGIMFAAVTLPADAVLVTGFVAKGGQFTKVFLAVNKSYGMRMAVKMAIKSVRTGSFSRSTAPLGRSSHNLYQEMKGAVKVGGDVLREFKVPGGRIDVLNNATKTIYELKPNNVSEILKGLRQLDRYDNVLGGGYKKVLDLY